ERGGATRLNPHPPAAARPHRLPLLPAAGDPPALHRHDQRDAGRQPSGDGAVQRPLLARLRRDRVAAAGGPPRAAGRGGPGANAGAGRRHLLSDAASLRLLHLQGPDRAAGRPVPAAARRGRAVTPVATHPSVHLTAQTRVLAAVIAIAFMAMILELIRRDHLQERYSVVWFIFGLGMLAGAAFPGLLTFVADL